MIVFVKVVMKVHEKSQNEHILTFVTVSQESLSLEIFFREKIRDLEKRARKENPFNFLLACKASIRSDGPPLTHRSDRSPFTQLQLSKSSDFSFKKRENTQIRKGVVHTLRNRG